MNTRDEDELDDLELDIIDADEPIPFLRPITNQQHSSFFGRQPHASLGCPFLPNAEPRPDELTTECAEVVPTTTDAPVPKLRQGDKTILYVGLESLFEADGKSPGTLPLCSALLEEYFGIAGGTFRPSQQEVCLGVLQGHHTLAVCPTGWGKSLCYQFPMLVHRLLFRNALEQWQRAREVEPAPETPLPMPVSRFCVVVSPLLSLMSDQADKISEVGALKAVVLSSQTGADREDRILQELASLTCSIDIVFISPEKLISHRRLRQLLSEQQHRLAMVCVDEVHCVSKWAYDFRPAFLYVSRLLEDLVRAGDSKSYKEQNRVSNALHFYGNATTPLRTTYLCLTATASDSVVADLRAAFHIESTIVCTDQARDNLHLESVNTLERAAVFSGSGDTADAKPTPPPARVIQDALLEAVQVLPHPMIIYVQSRADADEVSSYLASRLGCERETSDSSAAGNGGSHHPTSVFGRYDTPQSQGKTPGTAGGSAAVPGKRGQKRLVVRCYHAALSRSQRTNTQNQFLHDKVDVLVATVAFGMGIDKRNIRSIVHAQAPGSLEGYVQEVGRAGRDGQASVCRVLYNPFDYFDLRCRLWSSLLSPAELRDIVHAITSSPFTRTVHGAGSLALVSCARIATTLAIAEETVETILFLLLTLPPTGTLAGKSFYTGVLGGAALGYKVVLAADKQQKQQNHAGSGGITSAGHKRARGGDRAATLVPVGSGVSSLLAQLHARDPVMDALANTGPKGIENLIDFANQVGLSITDLQYRLDDLTASGALTLLPRGRALLVEMGPDAPELGTPAVLAQLTEWLFALYNGRLASQVDGLRALFETLRAPSHATVNRMLCDASAAQWKPPPARLTKVEAVFIANDFVEKNRLRIASSYDAARALLGVMPKSQISHGKFAGQLPLSHSWYVHSPHFGALREFDLDWVLRVLTAHELEIPSSTA